MDVFSFMKEVIHKCGYCEAIILKDGTIEWAEPSHNYYLIKISGYTEAEIWDMMPVSESPIYWLSDFTGCIPIWETFYIKPNIITDAQNKTLQILIDNKIIKMYK